MIELLESCSKQIHFSALVLSKTAHKKRWFNLLVSSANHLLLKAGFGKMKNPINLIPCYIQTERIYTRERERERERERARETICRRTAKTSQVGFFRERREDLRETLGDFSYFSRCEAETNTHTRVENARQMTAPLKRRNQAR